MQQTQIKRLLPAIYQAAVRPGNALFAILDVMEKLQAPTEAALDRVEVNFNPYRAPDVFVPYLASWVDLERLLDIPRLQGSSSMPAFSTGLGRLRELIAAAVTLSKWRGTRKGLCLFLETATGTKGFLVEERVADDNGRIKPFHVRVTAPKKLDAHRVLIEKIIDLEKPAYVTYELHFAAS